MIGIGLSLKKFEVKDYNTYLAPFIRTFTYFKNRGKHDSVKWHHIFAVVTGDDANGQEYVIEAVAKGVVRNSIDRLKFYDKVVLLEFAFDIDEQGFLNDLNNAVGQKYNFFLVMFIKAIYQTTGIWLLKKVPKGFDCSFLIGWAIFRNCRDAEVKEKYKQFERLDAQDFVRHWRRNHLYDIGAYL